MVFQDEVLKIFHAILMERMFQGSLRSVSRRLREFQGFFKEGLRIIQGRFRAV